MNKLSIRTANTQKYSAQCPSFFDTEMWGKKHFPWYLRTLFWRSPVLFQHFTVLLSLFINHYLSSFELYVCIICIYLYYTYEISIDILIHKNFPQKHTIYTIHTYIYARRMKESFYIDIFSKSGPMNLEDGMLKNQCCNAILPILRGEISEKNQK